MEIHMEKKEFICINCPQGCRLTVNLDADGQAVSVAGNACKRGEAYGRQEAVEPLRVLTALMRVKDHSRPLSVKTSKPIPKRLLETCVAEIRKAEVTPPVTLGEVILPDLCGTGADVVATAEYPGGEA